MNLKKFKQLYKIYSDFPLAKELTETPEYERYTAAYHDDKACSEWVLKTKVKAAGINPKKYCCLDMAYHLIPSKQAIGQEAIHYDAVIMEHPKRKEFGIPIHDGGSSYIHIRFCPWCGRKV